MSILVAKIGIDTVKNGLRQVCCIANVVLQSIHFLDPFWGPFSAVSTPIFTIKGAFFSIFQALHFFLCTIMVHSRFLWFFRTFAPFLQNFLHYFFLIFKGASWFCSSFVKFNRIFPGISQNFNNFGKREMSRFSYLRKMIQKSEKFCTNFAKFKRKIAENLSEKKCML